MIYEGLVKLRAIPDNSRECLKTSTKRKLPKAFRLSSKASKHSVWVSVIPNYIYSYFLSCVMPVLNFIGKRL